MFSKTCEYAIRAMIYISQHSKDGGKVGFKEVAKAIAAPESFIAKILQQLSKARLVQSSKGPHGGFYVDESSINKSLADVVRAIDGDQIFSGCGLGLPFCSEINPCPIHDEFKSIRSSIQQMLQSAKVSQFNDLLDRKLIRLRGD